MWREVPLPSRNSMVRAAGVTKAWAKPFTLPMPQPVVMLEQTGSDRLPAPDCTRRMPSIDWNWREWACPNR